MANSKMFELAFIVVCKSSIHYLKTLNQVFCLYSLLLFSGGRQLYFAVLFARHDFQGKGERLACELHARLSTFYPT